MNKTNFIIKNKKIILLINIFLMISYFISIIGIFMLYTYNNFYISIDLYKASIIVFRTGLMTAIFSVICGFAFNQYLNELKY